MFECTGKLYIQESQKTLHTVYIEGLNSVNTCSILHHMHNEDALKFDRTAAGFELALH